MKKMFLLLFVCIGIQQYSTAQTVQCVTFIKTAYPQIWGYITEDSLLYDQYLYKKLDFSHDGEYRDYDDQVVAVYNRTTGEIYNFNEELLNTVESDGDVKDAQGQLIGNVDVNGVYRDLNNHVIGSIPGADRFLVAYYFRHVYN